MSDLLSEQLSNSEFYSPKNEIKRTPHGSSSFSPWILSLYQRTVRQVDEEGKTSPLDHVKRKGNPPKRSIILIYGKPHYSESFRSCE
jgi:hypothetical protein